MYYMVRYTFSFQRHKLNYLHSMLYIYTVDKKIQIDFFTQENIHASLNISNVRTPKGTPQKIQQGTPLSKKSSSVPASIDNIENNDHYHHQVIS